MRFEKGRLSIACVCMVLGFMLAIQFRTTQDIKDNKPLQRVEVLTERILNDIRNSSGEEHSQKMAQDIVLLSGRTAVEGPGIVITIDDSSQKSTAGEDMNLYLVHDEDLLKVINELRAAGAEAISINGQRLTATSEIRCAGPTVSVNNVRSAPPFEIRAIGSIHDLENAINMRGGVADTLKVWGINMTLQSSNNVWIPAYKNPISYKYATKSAKQEEGK